MATPSVNPSNATANLCLKDKLAYLEDIIAQQGADIEIQEKEIEELRKKKVEVEKFYEGKLDELKNTMFTDICMVKDEVNHALAQQKSENHSLQQQITALKGEKTTLQQQLALLKKKIHSVEDFVGV